MTDIQLPEYTPHSAYTGELPVTVNTDLVNKQYPLDTVPGETLLRDGTCYKCGGDGKINGYAHVLNGVCFHCGGRCTCDCRSCLWTLKQERAQAARFDRKATRDVKRERALDAEVLRKWGLFASTFTDVVEDLAYLAQFEPHTADNLASRWTPEFPEQRQSIRERAAKRRESEARDAAAEDVPTGRELITGEILSTRSQEGAYGYEYKMLVRDDRGFKVWMTKPSALEARTWDGELKGERVSVVVTLEPSKDDPKFGFGKRPAKAQLI